MTSKLPPFASRSTTATSGMNYQPATEIVSIASTRDITKDPYLSSSIPIYQTATFKQLRASESCEYDYSRSGNPTRSHLEQHLAKIMSAKHAFVVSSGMGALDIITRMLRNGDEIVAVDDLYGGTHRLLTYLSTHNDIKTHHVDTTDMDSISPFLSSKTRLVLLETPTNPMCKVSDLKRAVKLVHEYSPNILVAVDNTMMSPYLQRPLELGVDIVYHSGTKYLSGHHDLMAGVIAVIRDDLAKDISFVVNAVGCALPPFDSFLLLRGVKTLAVRMDVQQRNALIIAQTLSQQHGFRVHYPGLESHAGHGVHKSQSSGFGAVLSFETGNAAKSELAVEGTKIWSISVSFGCINSLISMPCLMSHASIPQHIRASRQLPEDLIRLCVGIEDVGDLIVDLENALRNADLIPPIKSGCVNGGERQHLAHDHLSSHDASSASPSKTHETLQEV